MTHSSAKRNFSSITKSELALMLGYSKKTLARNLKSIGIDNSNNYLHPNDLKLFDQEFGLPEQMKTIG